MPDQGPSFEQVLETDLQHLATEIQKTRELPELKNAGERDIVKQTLRSLTPIKQTEDNGVPSAAPSSGPLPAYANTAAPEVKLEIEYLLDVALKQGISKALNEAQKSSDFVQDAFHDVLAGKLYPELQKRGMVK